MEEAPRAARKRRKGKKPGRKPAEAGVRISYKEIQAVKELVEQLGADKVQKLAAVLSR